MLQHGPVKRAALMQEAEHRRAGAPLSELDRYVELTQSKKIAQSYLGAMILFVNAGGVALLSYTCVCTTIEGRSLTLPSKVLHIFMSSLGLGTYASVLVFRLFLVGASVDYYFSSG